MKHLLVLFLLAGVPYAGSYGQSHGQLAVRVTVLPPALRVTVSSAMVDFAQQRAGGDAVVLDPATGEISGKVGGPHQLGVVEVMGRSGTRFAVSVETPMYLRGERADIEFALRWAHSGACGGKAYAAIPSAHVFTGLLGTSGRACMRFGGSLSLPPAEAGVYGGVVQVRLMAL